MSAEIVEEQVPESWAGEPVLELFAERLPWMSKTALRKLLHHGFLSRDGKVASPIEPLRAGEQLRLELPEAPAPPPAPSDRALWPEILERHGELLVLNKRPGISTLSAQPDQPSTLSAAQVLLAKLEGRPRRLYPVHRLDRETSGLLVMALGVQSARQLSQAFAERLAHKHYRALVHGQPPDEGEVEAEVGRAGRQGRMMVEGNAARAARTSFRVLERFRQVCWVELEPRTGRTHQIRVHMAHAGHPVVADGKYGGKPLLLSQLKGRKYNRGKREERPLIARVALHAARLRLPWQDAELELEAPLAGDLARCLKVLRKHARHR